MMSWKLMPFLHSPLTSAYTTWTIHTHASFFTISWWIRSFRFLHLPHSALDCTGSSSCHSPWTVCQSQSSLADLGGVTRVSVLCTRSRCMCSTLCSMAQNLEPGSAQPKVHPTSDLESGSEEDQAAIVGAGSVVCEHKHYSHRAPWLRALVLGANDGLVSIASLMLGVGAVEHSVKTMVVGGLAGLVAGACSMAIGEYVSVCSQRDSEKADVEIERQEHAKGPDACARELEELAQIYVSRGLSYDLAQQVAVELSAKDAIRAHARDELGIDMDDYSNPLQAAVASAVAFASGGAIPLLAAGFISDFQHRLIAVVTSTSLALALFGAVGARLGGAPIPRAALRVLIGGALAMLLTFMILKLFSAAGVSSSM